MKKLAFLNFYAFSNAVAIVYYYYCYCTYFFYVDCFQTL